MVSNQEYLDLRVKLLKQGQTNLELAERDLSNSLSNDDTLERAGVRAQIARAYGHLADQWDRLSYDLSISAAEPAEVPVAHATTHHTNVGPDEGLDNRNLLG